MHVRVCVYVHACVRVGVCVGMCVCVCGCMRTCVCACVWHSYVGLLFANDEKEKVGLGHIIFILLPNMSDLFLMSLTQTAGHKMAAPTILCSQLSNINV